MKKINLFSPFFDSNEIKATTKTIQSSFWASGSGTGLVKAFEEKFGKYVNSNCVAVDSGTAALHLALNILDIKDKEVIVPSLTFVSTIHAILYNGGIPKFIDVNNDTLCIDPKVILEKISPKTKVILPVHFGGFPCELDTIQKIARKNNLYTVEDAAHACGTKYKGKKIGSTGDLVCFSFHPVKNLAMPKGGTIAINMKNKLLKNKLNSLRWCGITNRKDSFYDIRHLGYNYYMDEISASIGIEQLKKLEKSNTIRKKIAKRYEFELNFNQKMPFNLDCSYHLYWIKVKNRNMFMKKMAQKGIETGSHYKPIHTMTFYKSDSDLKNTESIGNQIVTLPMHPNLSDNDVDRIINTANTLNK